MCCEGEAVEKEISEKLSVHQISVNRVTSWVSLSRRIGLWIFEDGEVRDEF